MYQLLHNCCINIMLLEVDKSVQNFTCSDMVNSPWFSFQDSWACFTSSMKQYGYLFRAWGSIFKSRDIALPTKFRLVKAMVFPVVMYQCESWTVKKAECQRIDDFELWCWRRPFRVPWTARRSNQFILKEIIPGISLEGMMLKLKLQYFGHLMQRADSLEKTLMLGGIGGRRRREWQRIGWHHWLDRRESGWTPGVGDGQGGLAYCDSWCRKELDTIERLNWTELMFQGYEGTGLRKDYI